MALNNTIISASFLNSDTVKNAQGENLGDIKDIMINTENGQVQYYVLSFRSDSTFSIIAEFLSPQPHSGTIASIRLSPNGVSA